MADEQETTGSESEEIRDILIAISVIAKRLASKLEGKMQEVNHEKNEGTVNDTR